MTDYLLRISPPALTGLDFPSNGDSGSDIRLVWSGSDLLPRNDHTAIWRAQYVQQTGYYATAWHSANDGSWGSYSADYSFGTHPYPCDGEYNGSGQATGPTSGSGTEHYQEIAGIGAIDHIQNPDGPWLVVKDGRWLVQARTCETSGSDVVHKFYPDVENSPGEYIGYTDTIVSLGSPPTEGFYFGASDWTASGSTNDECPSGVLRGFRLFDVALSSADIITESEAIGNNTAATSAGLANTWYINDNPTPTDVTDKSSESHDPSWANANRPTLWTP